MRPDQTALAGRVIPAVSLNNCPGAARAASGAFSGASILTPAVLARVQAMRDQGMSFDRIGAHLGVSGTAVSVAMRKHTGLDARGNPVGTKRRVGRMTEEKRELILSLRAQGTTLSGISATSGFAYSTVQQVLREARAEGDWRAEPTPEARAEGARASEWHLPAKAKPEAPEPVTDRLVLSLMMSHGLSRSAAEDTAAAHRRRA